VIFLEQSIKISTTLESEGEDGTNDLSLVFHSLLLVQGFEENLETRSFFLILF